MPAGLELFLIASVIGVVVTAPPGPAAALVVARTLHRGFAAGLRSGLGIAAAEAVLAWVAAAGFAAVADKEWAGHRWIALGAVPVLLLLAVHFWRRARRPVELPDGAGDGARSAATLLGDAGSTLLIALLAPGTLPGLVALYSATGIATQDAFGWSGTLIVCGGVLTGASCWWLAVCTGVARLRDRAQRWLPLLDGVSAGLLVLAAGYAVWIGVR